MFVARFKSIPIFQLSRDNEPIGTQNDDAESNFHGPAGLVLHTAMVIVPVLPDLGAICAR